MAETETNQIQCIFFKLLLVWWKSGLSGLMMEILPVLLAMTSQSS